MGKQFFYRGYLTSCNYRCGYCPFSKRKMTEEQSRKDQEALDRFVCQMEAETVDHALLIVPYGEALIHEYYWVAMARLSQFPAEEYVGCQTNLSFPVEKMLSIYEACGGEKRKLRLWCTFHPTMTTVETFVMQCKKLGQAGITYCAGVVGDPANISLIRELREQLPDDVYVWINKMDGRQQRYTEEEMRRFLEVDPYFHLELQHWQADLSKCRKSVFQEADGSRYFCNLHASQAGGGRRNLQVSQTGECRQNLHASQAGGCRRNLQVSQTGGCRQNIHTSQAGGYRRNLQVSQTGECRYNIHGVQAEGECQDLNVNQTEEINHNFYLSQEEGVYTDSVCKRRECSCYLAYCNRTDVEELLLFEPYPAFRIPSYPKGIFLDVDGTLVKEGKRSLSDAMADKIRWLSKKSRLFLATALPYPEAMGKCRKIADCFSGGVFADGGHILVWESAGDRNRRIKWEEVIPLPVKTVVDEADRVDIEGLAAPGSRSITTSVNEQGSFTRQVCAASSTNIGGLAAPDSRSITASVGCRSYQIRGVLYKQTLFSRRKQGWMPGEAKTLIGEIEAAVSSGADIRIHREKHHIGILSSQANKRAGVEKICAREGIALEEGMAVGNEEEDLPMLSLFSRSMLVDSVMNHKWWLK